MRPLAVAAFCEEEGARFGVACLGSRLLAGAIEPARARALADSGGTTFAGAMTAAGQDPAALGPDQALVAGIGAYVELHIEQGRALADLGAAIGVAERIWPHGRWRLTFTGRADHAGTTRLGDRRDPMLAAAATILAARGAAARHGSLATIGKLIAEPGAVNAISSSVTAWLDARAPDEARLHAVVDDVLAQARTAAVAHGVDAGLRPGVGHARRGLRRRTPRPDGGHPGRRRDRGRRCCPPGRATTPGCWPRGCRPACFSCATRPGSPIRPPSTRSRGTAPPG